MDDQLRALLDELYAAGLEHDAALADRRDRLRNLEPDTAAALTAAMREAGVRTAVEIGTSNGYSAIWLADAAGFLVSVDVAPPLSAIENVRRAGLADRIEFVTDDGGHYLAGLPDEGLDLLFLDAERTEYVSWWPHPRRVLRAGGILAVDNVLSHPDEVAGFLALADADPSLDGRVLPVGKGLYLAHRSRPPAT
jgi:predicted O-methyltransferase YrrM